MPSTCKKTTGHWLVHASISCHMVFVCRVDSFMVQIVGQLQHIVHHGSLVRTCFNFVSRIDWHMVQVEVGQLQSDADHWSLVLVFPRQTTWGGTLLPKRMFWFYDREGPPPEKKGWRFGQGGVPPPPGAQSFLWVSIWSLVRIRFNCVFMGFVLMDFNLATIDH